MKIKKKKNYITFNKYYFFKIFFDQKFYKNTILLI
jgi:hypothetical protein